MRQHRLWPLFPPMTAAPAADPKAADPDAAPPPLRLLRRLSDAALGSWHGAVCAEMKYRLGGPDPLADPLAGIGAAEAARRR